MIRFPNPGSDISAFVRTFQALYRSLGQHATFSLDDISSALIDNNLATSSGHIGAEALKRSTRDDRTLDPLFNQSKMYSELFRILGWLHPTTDGKQTFVFSYLGTHIGTAENEPTSLVKECLLGIAYPNPLVKIKGSNFVRPVTTIVLAASSLGGRITRDEIILGPMDIENDRDPKLFGEMIQVLRSLRGHTLAVASALENKADDLKIQVNTLHNYTRFPLGILRWAAWTRPERNEGVYDVLTPEGLALADQIKTYCDIRAKDLAKVNRDEIDYFLRVASYRMLERGGYSLKDLRPNIDELEGECKGLLVQLGIKDTTRILFSPFQECDPRQIEKLFPVNKSSRNSDESKLHIPVSSSSGRPRSYQGGQLKLRDASKNLTINGILPNIIGLIVRYADTEGITSQGIAERVFADYQGSSKDVFYPAVEKLFQALDYDCACSRVGVNYQRMDAMIRHETDSIPIEIKSPAEQIFVSVKGVRQALENKVVLVARKYAPSQWETTSLVVGYQLPPDRSEVLNLVDDVYSTYRINIGIVDFQSLVTLVTIRLFENKRPDDKDFFCLKGVAVINDT